MEAVWDFLCANLNSQQTVQGAICNLCIHRIMYFYVHIDIAHE